MFSQKINREGIAKGVANTPPSIYMNVDVAVQSITYQLDEPWLGRHQRGEFKQQDLEYAARQYNNVSARR